MALVKISNFKGLLPASAPELLPDFSAQVAKNCSFVSGQLEPIYEGELIYTSSNPNEILTFFHLYKDLTSSVWLTWDKIIQGYVSTYFTEKRFYYTGDYEPRVTTYDLATDVTKTGSYPRSWRVLGVPSPRTKPTITPSSILPPVVSRVYCYTFVDNWGQESAPSPVSDLTNGNTTATWTISNIDVAPPDTGGITALTYSGTAVTITSANAHFNRTGERIIIKNITTVTDVVGEWTITSVNYATNTITFSVSTTPTGTFNSAVDTTAAWERAAPFVAPFKKRIYRTTGLGGTFQLVAEIPGANTSYIDSLSDADIPGNELITVDWVMPPVNLTLIGLHPSGSLVGFVNNEIYFSEPFQHHAWPIKYKLKTDSFIIGGGVFANNIGICTTGAPHLVYGNAPGQFAVMRYDSIYPCVSARSIISSADSLIYASTAGLVNLTTNSISLLTTDIYSEWQWRLLSPNSFVGAQAHGVLYFAHTPVAASPTILVFGKDHSIITKNVRYLYTSEVDGNLYYNQGNQIFKLHTSNTNYIEYEWKSKEFVLPYRRSFSAAKVRFEFFPTQAQTQQQYSDLQNIINNNNNLIAGGDLFGAVNTVAVNDVYPVNGSKLLSLTGGVGGGGGSGQIDDTTGDGWITPTIGDCYVWFDLFADGALLYSTKLIDSRPFRLPHHRAMRYSVRVRSKCRIKSIELGDNVVELQNG